MPTHHAPRASLLAVLAALAALVPVACGPGQGRGSEPTEPDRPESTVETAAGTTGVPLDSAGSVLGLSRMTDGDAIPDTVRREYEDRFGLTWLAAAPFNNSQALATTPELAARHGLQTYSDLAGKAPDLRLGGPAEFATREDGLPGLQAEYGGFLFQAFVTLGTGLLRYDGLRDGLVDVVVAFGTDGRIAADGLVVLEDDRRYYPLYQVAPVVRLDALAAHPDIAPVLDALAPLLTDTAMASLNYQVDVAGRPVSEVAAEFVRAMRLERAP